MKINDTYFISGKRKSSIIVTNLFSKTGVVEELSNDDANFYNAQRILKVVRSRTYNNKTKNNGLRRFLSMAGIDDTEISKRLFPEEPTSATTVNPDGTVTETIVIDRSIVKQAISKMINFFSEFNFSPSFRFINSFALSLDKREYVRNYFVVQDHPYTTEIADKIKSAEFNEIMHAFEGCSPKAINTRFELFFGEPGTGKTTEAMSIAEKCVVCSSDMLPADLMQNFAFNDGKAGFEKSDLWIAMEEGKAIVMDEVNMLPFESLRFLQGITDGKETIDYKGHTIHIHPSFKIYATMNLNVNGQCIPLPAPLVDRSYEIREFKLSADDLLSAVI